MPRFADFVRTATAAGRLVVQPRMGFGELARMRAGLTAVRDCRATTIGTVTLDSYTRVGDYASARRALREGAELNGFPLLAHGAGTVRDLLREVSGDAFPVQIRHGSPLPLDLFRTMVAAGVDATEGGPVSYCLPYGRVPLPEAADNWARCSELAARAPDPMHLETFGGCMLGQLCPPSLLVALSVLEAMFFHEHGLRSISLSYAQQVHLGQDLEALAALRELAAERLPGVQWHVTLYTYMGVFPRTPIGSYRLVEDSVRLAVHSGTERLIVKTPAEARRIPAIEENAEALEFADAVARQAAADCADTNCPPPTRTGLLTEARTLIDATLELGRAVGSALVTAFARGVLDVPYCLHRDNANAARAVIDERGMLGWSKAGGMPVTVRDSDAVCTSPLTADRLTTMLAYNERRYDREDLVGSLLRSSA
ncbi:methylaspartate mutase [Streptomyces coacervatus]|uniref:Methylaspartate mutase n=1 Tax=Streptomyces coacervatus TaxID=647381 RepID=A0ABP7H0W4_9ACTN|nr:methylaspartate mutase [Streptomyces coacervatus]MDF2268161.1 methylaspartate mutase [Streptomyces coacervatus]